MNVAALLRERVWTASIPLEISLHSADCASYEALPYLVHVPRLSYLAFLLPKLHTYFHGNLIYPDVSPTDAWLDFDNVPLKWHYPLGLLYDLYSGAEPASSHNTPAEQAIVPSPEEEETPPWKLTLHFSGYPKDQLVQLDAHEKHLHDWFINKVKEADYLRNGTGKTVMSLSKEDSEQLWEGVKHRDYRRFSRINNKLLNPQGATLRHVPMRLYLPHAASPLAGKPSSPNSYPQGRGKVEQGTMPGSVRVVQGLVPVSSSSRQRQTVGTALNALLPNLFRNTRGPCLIAAPVLHGAILPLDAGVEDLIRTAAYVDGWLHIAFLML
ncbi:Autophagy protein 5 [Paraconiothyrium brasiliense]|uniref:Autophagy protein 5 n=1 Tax=Paraconiothyrium brasiliense TaxID=300254 RepID=A0ABR3QHH4_9PLEO